MKRVEKIAVLTGGGDCPGLNAVIRSVVKTSIANGIEVLGVRDGFRGALEGDFIPLSLTDVSGILPRGGTILGTTNRDNPFAYPVNTPEGIKYEDRSDQVLKNLCKQNVDAVISIGGDGSLSIALKLAQKGLAVVGVPKTIDNDLLATDQTFGFQTAVSTAQDALDKLHTTAESHHRIMILEVMGRYAGWIALYAGVAGGADVILIPEIGYDLKRVAQAIRKRSEQGKKFSIVVVAEGAAPIDGEMVIERKFEGRTDPIKLGGIGAKVAKDLEELGIETRVTVLGHLQRGGSPNAYDRVLATRYGAAAVQSVIDKDFGTMVALRGTEIVRVHLADAVNKIKVISLNDSLLTTAKDLGIELGGEL